jgi:hypothetical protein
MISAILLINQQGEVIISRFYRDNISRSAADAFRLQVIAAKEAKSPITMIDRASFLYIRKGNVYMVAITKSNAHPGVIFEVLHRLVHIFEVYFGAEFDETSIRNNFVIIYELLDGKLLLQNLPFDFCLQNVSILATRRSWQLICFKSLSSQQTAKKIKSVSSRHLMRRLQVKSLVQSIGENLTSSSTERMKSTLTSWKVSTC